MKKIKILMFLVTLIFIACNKEGADEDLISLNEDDMIDLEVVIEETENVIDDISMYSESVFGISSSTSKGSNTSKSNGPDRHGHSGFFKNCADITVEETDDTIITTITFSGECEDKNGNTIFGTITKVRTKSDESRTKTVTIDNLSINGYVINGTKEYTYTTSNVNGNPEMTGSVNITVETDDGTISKVGTRTVEITAGGDTYFWFDDEKTIIGSYTYTNANGESFSVEITTPLVKPAGCKYIASGVKEYTSAEGTTVMDFGDGTCDKVATKTSPDGTVTEVKLHRKRRHK